MTFQLSDSDQRLACRYTPIYVDMHGRLYAGQEVIKVLETEPLAASSKNPLKTDYDKTHTSGSRYSRPQFGCHGMKASASTAGPTKPEPSLSEETASTIKYALSSPAYSKELIAGVLKSVPPNVRSLIGLTSLPLAIMGGIVLDCASGRDLKPATVANVSGVSAGFAISSYVEAAIRASFNMRYVAQAAMMGAGAVSGGATLLGILAGIVAYNIVSGVVYALLELYDYSKQQPLSSNRAFFGYDDFLTDYP
jgi:hypothetical protein